MIIIITLMEQTLFTAKTTVIKHHLKAEKQLPQYKNI